MKSLVSAAALLGAAGLLAGCNQGPYPSRNESISVAQDDKYDWNSLPPDALPKTLVIVTASGGGARAATLALGVLRGMDSVELQSGPGGTLADQVDVISSVSGGSVTAAYFALHGANGLRAFKKDFIDAHNMWQQLNIVFRPDELLHLASPLVERSDILINHLEKIYGQTTFGDLARLQRRPYLIVNGADLAEGSVFPFTQPTLGLLCSDLSKMKISTAVAASAAFPLAYTPVTLRNYCPPVEVTPSDDRAKWYKDPPQARWQRISDDYSNGRKPFVHVIDGGVADNLGISEPYRLLTRDDTSPSFKKQIAEGSIQKIIVVAINARTQSDTDNLDRREAPPKTGDEIGRTVGDIRGTAANWTMDGLRILLTERLRVMALDAPGRQAANFRRAAENTAFITVDFETLPMHPLIVDGKETTCRKLFNAVPTSWSLSEERRNGLVALGQALFVSHPDFKKAMKLVDGKLSSEGEAMTIEKACETLVPKKK